MSLDPVPSPIPSAYLTPGNLSQQIGVSVITLQQWRRHAKGPAFVRLGRTIRYARVDVEAWLEARKVGKAVVP